MSLKFNEIRWGSIGCGDVMEVKSGPALQNVKHSQLTAVMRRDGSLARDFARRHGVPRWYDQASVLLQDPDINAIYIATPPDTHLKYTRIAAETGRAIYVEKPMANSFAECQEMMAICEASAVPLFVAYYRRALPAFLKVRDILASGVLGELQTVRVQLLHPAKPSDIAGELNWRVDPSIAGCGYFCDLASHIFDLLQFLLGDIVSASGFSENRGGHYVAEDHVEAEFAFAGGVQGSGEWDFNAPERLDLTIITGSRGWVSYSHFEHTRISLATVSGQELFDLPHPRHIQQPLIQLIVDELRGMGQSPSTGHSAAKTNWVLDRILGRI